MEISDKLASQEIREKLIGSNYKDAFLVLKRNPMAPLQLEDAKLFLNNLDSLGSENENEEKNTMKMTESANYIYRRLERQKVLKGFGCVDGEYPEKALDVSPSKLEELSGLKVSSLTPKQRTTYWRLAGVGLCLAEYIVGSSLGIDPLYTLIPITFAGFISDQVFLKGAVFETIYQKLFPEYKEKIIAHEAGHFLIAYLLGLSVRGCITNAWQAQKYREIQGQAGTMFFDSRLMDEVANQKVKRSSLDRLSVVIMAGIAAEALKFGKAEGGASDEQSLITFFTSIQPPWNLLRIQGQARWGVLQSLLLIKEHQAAYDALFQELSAGGGVGDCVLAIESNLPETLPSSLRIAEREKRLKRIETDRMLRYVQRMTWRAGGIDPAPEPDALFSTASDHDNGNALEDGMGSNSAMNGLNKDAIDNDALDVVSLFTQKIRSLEEAVRSGKTPSTIDSEGVWLNNLDSVKTSLGPKELTDVVPSGVKIPEPLPDFEKRVEALQEKEKQEVAVDVPLEVTIEPVAPAVIPLLQSNVRPTVTPKELLLSHRGFQIRQLENQEIENKRRVAKIDKRLIELKKDMLTRESVSASSRSSRW